jgi:hypothetical protein
MTTLRDDLLDAAQRAARHAKAMLIEPDATTDVAAAAALLSAAAAATEAARDVSTAPPAQAS